jgi:two-component system chemotaxis response regulator CheY
MGWKSQDQSINLVLTDQNMPRMDGLTLIKNLRGMPQYAKTPILMLTTESSDAMKAQACRRCDGLAGQAVRSAETD